MSHGKHGHIRPSFQEEFLAGEMGELVSCALRGAHEGEASPVKKISKRTGIAPDSVKRWYTGKKPPTIGHFLMLVQNYPEVLKRFLEASGHGYLAAHVRSIADTNDENPASFSGAEEVVQDVPKNVPKKPLNERQRWFLILLRRLDRARAEDIAVEFGVALKTAKRDIEGLKDAGEIHFVGSKRTGRYQIADG